jgi:hypothetical protein
MEMDMNIKQDEIPSSCGKGQGQHMEKKIRKKISRFLAIFLKGLSFNVADCSRQWWALLH